MSKATGKSKITQDWNDVWQFFNDIKPVIDESPIKAVNLLRGFHRNSLKGHHKRVKHTIVHAYACALRLKKSEKLTSKFYSQEFFLKRKYKLDEANLLRMTMCYVFGSLEGSNYGQALSYERAVRPFFMRGASQGELSEALSAKSLDDLEEEAKAEKDARKNSDWDKATRKKRKEEDETNIDKSDVIIKDEEGEDEDKSEKSSESDHESQAAEAQVTAAVNRELKLSDLRLASTDRISLRLFKDPAYKRGSIDYEREETASGFVRIVAIEVHPKS